MVVAHRLPKVLILFGVSNKVKRKKAFVFRFFVDNYVAGIVENLGASGLKLLYISKVGVSGTLADGEDAVEVVEQALTVFAVL